MEQWDLVEHPSKTSLTLNTRMIICIYMASIEGSFLNMSFVTELSTINCGTVKDFQS